MSYGRNVLVEMVQLQTQLRKPRVTWRHFALAIAVALLVALAVLTLGLSVFGESQPLGWVGVRVA